MDIDTFNAHTTQGGKTAVCAGFIVSTAAAAVAVTFRLYRGPFLPALYTKGFILLHVAGKMTHSSTFRHGTELERTRVLPLCFGTVRVAHLVIDTLEFDWT